MLGARQTKRINSNEVHRNGLFKAEPLPEGVLPAQAGSQGSSSEARERPVTLDQRSASFEIAATRLPQDKEISQCPQNTPHAEERRLCGGPETTSRHRSITG